MTKSVNTALHNEEPSKHSMPLEILGKDIKEETKKKQDKKQESHPKEKKKQKKRNNLEKLRGLKLYGA